MQPSFLGSWSYLIAGGLVGFMISSVGVGGGSVMTPLLIGVFRIPVYMAITADLLYALTVDIFAVFLHRRENGIDLNLVFTVGGSGAVGAVVGSLIFSYGVAISPSSFDHVLKVIIGLLLVISAMLSIWIRVTHKKHSHEAVNIRNTRRSMILVGFITGIIVSFTSVGAGAIIMLFLLHYWHIPLERVVGTDLAIALLVVGTASLSHLLTTTVDPAVLLPLVLGGILGAALGERFHRKVDKEKIKLAINAVLMLVGLTMLISSH